jgi:hypothetical protein
MNISLYHKIVILVYLITIPVVVLVFPDFVQYDFTYPSGLILLWFITPIVCTIAYIYWRRRTAHITPRLSYKKLPIVALYSTIFGKKFCFEVSFRL